MAISRTVARSLLVALSLSIDGHAVSAADTWVEVRSPNFTVVSNAGERTARSVAWQFEQVRGAIEKGWSFARVKLNRPLLVVAVKDEASMKALAPSFWEKGSDIHPGSVFLSAADRHYILLRSDVHADDHEGVNPYRSAYWSYSALTLDSSFGHALPLWFVTGLSAVLSNSIVRESEIQFGRPIPDFVRRIQLEPRATLRQLLAVDRQSPYYTQQPSRGRFDAQCWGLMEYLLFKAKGPQSDSINAVTKLLLEGTPSEAALEKTYGALDALDQASQVYVKNGMFTYSRLQVDTDVAAQKYPARELPAADSAVVRAGLLLAMGRPIESHALLAQAESLDGSLAALHEVEALSLDRERKADDVRKAFEQAASGGSSNFYVYFRLATSTWHQNADPATLAEVQKLLGKSIALNDAFAPAFAWLGSVLLQLNQPDNALGLVERAAMLEPAQVSHRVLATRVLMRMSRREEALKTARAAMELARTDTERRSVQSLLDSLAGPGAPAATPAPPSQYVRVGDTVQEPTRVKYVPPVYPAVAQSAKVQGVVILEATIAPSGHVSTARVIRSIPLLDQAAVDAVRQWEYSPTLLNGGPVPVIMTVTVNFTLQ